MKRVIVSGANGFVGSAVVKALLDNNIQVITLDKEGCHDNIPVSENVKFFAMDLEDLSGLEALLSDEKGIDVFYHFAWAGSAGAARADTELQLKNAQWTVDCLRLARRMNCERFVAAGSIMEHETMAAAFTSGNRPGLGYIYGSAKLVAHTMCMSVAADIGIDLIWAEITNAYGVGEKSPRFINTTIRKILKEEELKFTSGAQNYDFVYITDVAQAFYLIGKNGKPFHEYLIGSSSARPLREFVLEIKQTLAPTKDFIFGDVPFTGTDLPLCKFDCTRTEEDTGFRAQVPFSKGVRLTMDWIKEQEAGL